MRDSVLKNPWIVTLTRSIAVARESLRLEREAPSKQRRTRTELEFLPAALEIIESPPSPLGRGMAWTLASVLLLAFLWAIVGRLDVVAVAAGKVVPSGRSKVIQPIEIGTIRQLNVRDGQFVRAGEVLVQLDPTSAVADRERLENDLITTRTEVARLNAARSDSRMEAPRGADATLVATNAALLESQKREYESHIAAMGNEINRKQADREGARAAVVKLEKSLEITRERVAIRRDYYERGFFPRLQLLEAEQQLIEQEQQLRIEQHREQEAIQAIASLEKQRTQAQAEYMKGVLVQLADGERRAASTKQELVKAEQRQSAQTLVAPIDGVVQQLAVHTVGGVVSPAQALMVIVPQEDTLEVEASVTNRDVGFVHAGQQVEVKLETFPFTKYGTIPGVVESVSRDAVADEKQGLNYPARVRIDRDYMQVNERRVPLTPGMAATVEIKTSDRRLIEYILSPILRYKHESMRER